MSEQQQQQEELTPTPEQVRGFQQRVRATLALSAMDKYFATLTGNQLFSHPAHTGCILVPQLAQELLLLDLGEKVGIGAPPKHARWLNFWPFDAIVASKKELFFVSKSFEWAATKMPRITISTGELPTSVLLSKLCNQEETYLYSVADVRLVHSAQLLSEGNPVKVFKSLEGVPIAKTREVYETKHRQSIDNEFTRTEQHFSGQ